VLHSFTGPPDGTYPAAGVVVDKTGNIYGTTVAGGAYNLGTVFRIDKTGKEKVFYAFKGMPDGSTPGILLPGISGGEFYGVTSGGGAFGYGTVFKLDRSGNEVVLYSFTGGLDGVIPNGLVLDAAGKLYGTTYGGGKSDMGTVFKLTPGGIETVLYSFSGMPDGQYPNGAIRDAAGNLYGTTSYGGPYPHCGLGYGCGIVFRISPTGGETVLHSFKGIDGYGPLGKLIRDAQGNLYGTTNAGGSSIYGTVFKLSPSGEEIVFYSFLGDADGELPTAGLVRDAAGNLYGTTQMGGNQGSCYEGFFYSGCGIVFEVSPSGRETVLHIFSGPDGEYPGPLTRDAWSGKLYGTASAGGSCRSPYGCGVVFVLTPHD
jgi:uncharacterized repeat protein (TIGR03803 family)